ncbi:MAG TPA: hypothetical protein VFY06_12325 [Verrucomicrobiae bacterium]|nr:hypothetical protein [Verrucomicrobiae bacterium]
MNTTHQTRRLTRRVVLAAAAVLAFYVATVGAIPAAGRHMEDGKLQWIRGSSTASMVMEIYEWPARQIAVLPPMRALLELSANIWCNITDAPETTG